jgi:hypothetical protein
MQEIRIRYRPGAFTGVAVVALLMTAVFATLYVQKVAEHKKSVDLLQSFYLGLTVASVMLMIRSFRNMSTKKPMMTIGQNGITDYANLDGLTVKWENVLKAEVTRFGATDVMAVYINNAAELTKHLKKTKQRMADAKTKKVGTPVCLAVKIHDFDPASVITTINSMAGAKVEQV